MPSADAVALQPILDKLVTDVYYLAVATVTDLQSTEDESLQIEAMNESTGEPLPVLTISLDGRHVRVERVADGATIDVPDLAPEVGLLIAGAVSCASRMRMWSTRTSRPCCESSVPASRPTSKLSISGWTTSPTSYVNG